MKITKEQKIRIFELLLSISNGVDAIQHYQMDWKTPISKYITVIQKNREELNKFAEKDLYTLVENSIIFNDGDVFYF